MLPIIHGKIHGKTIELVEDIGLADGEDVEVIVKAAKHRRPGSKSPEQSLGAIADWWAEEDDRILEEIQADRNRPSHREISE